MDKVPFLYRFTDSFKTTKTLINTGNTTSQAYLLCSMMHYYNSKTAVFICQEEESMLLKDILSHFTNAQIYTIHKKITLYEWYKILQHTPTHTPTIYILEDIKELLTQYLPLQNDIQTHTITLKKGDTLTYYKLFEELNTMGYNTSKEDKVSIGEYKRMGDTIYIHPTNSDVCYRIDTFGDSIDAIYKDTTAVDDVHIWPCTYIHTAYNNYVQVFLEAHNVIVADENSDEVLIDNTLDTSIKSHYHVFRSFVDDDKSYLRLDFFSVLPYYTLPDFIVDIKERTRLGYKICIVTKKYDALNNLFTEYNITYNKDTNPVYMRKIEQNEYIPHSFQCTEQKIIYLTDREIFQYQRISKAKKSAAGFNRELLSSLKYGDYAIHMQHGVARFEGIVRRENTDNTASGEYLKLCYADNDKLFIPVENSEKITKYLQDEPPTLTRLGSQEWIKTQKKLTEETEKLAKELLQIYASREKSSKIGYLEDDLDMENFYNNFKYELTPGQAQSWFEVKRDMESSKPMDRLVCGDVGFGKTEIALRACYKAYRSGRQCAFLSPITILAEQHYETFQKRLEGMESTIKIALMSRFQSDKEQRDTIKKLKLGLVDVVIGTHRLLSDDIEFSDLGLLIIDEEQRFGVKQKEKLKKIRSHIDILTMTATPIPRTLNMGLGRLKDISTITTPPPGRLPVITEVRRYNLNLIRERIEAEIARGGQAYILHNEVQSMEGLALQMRSLMPKIRFITAHGQMQASELEAKIHAFKRREADVLIASTIIENGIDMDNANTLIVNHAEKFGLSQLYQLRGRVGRGRTQAYSYFLYHNQKLDSEAKKRLRAIVEASELGSGFQIAIRDLEIRGAGEILGASQSGTMKSVGVTHFMKMLQSTISKIEAGESVVSSHNEEQITVELPLSSYIPSHYIPSVDEKIQVYQELANSTDEESLDAIIADMTDDYGMRPLEVDNLIRVLKLKMLMKRAHLIGIKVRQISHNKAQIVIRMSKDLRIDKLLEMLKTTDNKWIMTADAMKLEYNVLPIDYYERVYNDILKMI